MNLMPAGRLESSAPEHPGVNCKVCNAYARVWWIINGHIVCNSNLCKTEAFLASNPTKSN